MNLVVILYASYMMNLVIFVVVMGIAFDIGLVNNASSKMFT